VASLRSRRALCGSGSRRCAERATATGLCASRVLCVAPGAAGRAARARTRQLGRQPGTGGGGTKASKPMAAAAQLRKALRRAACGCLPLRAASRAAHALAARHGAAAQGRRAGLERPRLPGEPLIFLLAGPSRARGVAAGARHVGAGGCAAAARHPPLQARARAATPACMA
jgi:hypothetical protein